MKDMIRIEVIANHSVEENILEALQTCGAGKYYTKYPSVFGVGSSGPRMGDAVWPEENFALVVWCSEEEARLLAQAVAGVKEQFPDEGIKVFGLPETAAEERTAPETAPPVGAAPAPAEGAPRPALVDAPPREAAAPVEAAPVDPAPPRRPAGL